MGDVRGHGGGHAAHGAPPRCQLSVPLGGPGHTLWRERQHPWKTFWGHSQCWPSARTRAKPSGCSSLCHHHRSVCGWQCCPFCHLFHCSGPVYLGLDFFPLISFLDLTRSLCHVSETPPASCSSRRTCRRGQQSPCPSGPASRLAQPQAPFLQEASPRICLSICPSSVRPSTPTSLRSAPYWLWGLASTPWRSIPSS